MRTIIILLAACLIGPAAWAHAFLERASPGVGSEVPRAPAQLSLTFTEPVEQLFSSVAVTDQSGKRVEQGKPGVGQDKQVLVVKLQSLPPGVYVVNWHVTSVDTHKTEGHFQFTVKP
jgi:copper resistance protein C